MSQIGKIANAILSASNENNLSLANLNFDFSLIQIEAPKEFKPLGSALSVHRRQDAEQGKPHRTARRLGALFEDIIPSTPRLVEAFGQRVSEIVKTPGINPQGAAIHGPFEMFVGADGTALWAAATSGIPAIGVYLLSCLLARAWDAKQATSIWVELVKNRQKEIETAYENSHIVSASALFNARQEISRDDLARWDNSARSWLRRADQARVFECDQLMLIAKNLQLPVATGSSTYTSVINLWKETMLGMDALLAGNPVMVTNGSLFLAISSWHIFPDLIVLGRDTTHVRFGDRLFPPGGRCTAGCEVVTTEIGGVRWSLALSHLQYYGDPVIVRSNPDFSRVTFPELKLVILGYIFREWRISDRDHSLVAQWLVKLWAVIQQLPENSNKSNPPFGWLRLLVDAAEEFLNAEGRAKQKNIQLLRFGRRRGALFSVDESETLLPLFGISSPLRLMALSQNDDLGCGIYFLRRMAEDLGLHEDDSLICYATDTASKIFVVTALPHVRPSKKRNNEGLRIDEKIHTRWAISRKIKTGHDHPHAGWTPETTEQGEVYYSTTTTSLVINEAGSTFTWPVTPSLFSLHQKASSGEVTHKSDCCNCFESQSTLDIDSDHTGFHLIYGDRRFGLYVRSDVPFRHGLQLCAEALARNPGKVPHSSGFTLIPTVLSNYLSMITRHASYQNLSDVEKHDYDQAIQGKMPGIFLVGQPSLPIAFCRMLFILELVSRVYSSLEGATISLSVLSKPFEPHMNVPGQLCEPPEIHNALDNVAVQMSPAKPISLTRQWSFACVAYFDSGYTKLDLENLDSVFALCSEDSIFVASSFLLDPFERSEPHRLRRIVGNISHPGITLLVAPEESKIRKPTDQYNAVTHASYDWQRENNFTGTTLHLSFTDWQIPLQAEGYRSIDQDVRIVESVISVLDRGKWVADLDILCIGFDVLTCIAWEHDRHACETHNLEYDYVSIDNWDELLDRPEGVGIFRAHGNWAARLAAVSILSQQGQGHSIAVFGRRNICFKCLEEKRGVVVFDLMGHEPPLPLLCID